MTLESVNALFSWVGAVIMGWNKFQFVLVLMNDNVLQLLGTFIVHLVDNECPQELKDIIVHQNKNKLELVPPHDHRTNPAEKRIDTFKCHLISGLSAMDPNFPLHLWCRILP